MLDENTLHSIYNWVDSIPYSRQKRYISRDFSDGVLMAETIQHFIPHLVEIHNYVPANSISQKRANWETLKFKVFKKLHIKVSSEEVEAIINCVPGAIEALLLQVREVVEQFAKRQAAIAENKTSSGSIENPTEKIVSNNEGTITLDDFNQTNTQNINHRISSKDINVELLAEKELEIQHLKEANAILDEKAKKLQQLITLKDARIATLSKGIVALNEKLRNAGLE